MWQYRDAAVVCTTDVPGKCGSIEMQQLFALLMSLVSVAVYSAMLLMRSFFFKISMLDTPYLTHEGEVWGVSCEFTMVSSVSVITVLCMLLSIDTYMYMTVYIGPSKRHLTVMLIRYTTVIPLGIAEIDHHCSRKWLYAQTTPSHYLNQCWFVINKNKDDFTISIS